MHEFSVHVGTHFFFRVGCHHLAGREWSPHLNISLISGATIVVPEIPACVGLLGRSYCENLDERDIDVHFPSNGICLVSDKKRDEFVSCLFRYLKSVQHERIKYISQFHNINLIILILLIKLTRLVTNWYDTNMNTNEKTFWQSSRNEIWKDLW